MRLQKQTKSLGAIKLGFGNPQAAPGEQNIVSRTSPERNHYGPLTSLHLLEAVFVIGGRETMLTNGGLGRDKALNLKSHERSWAAK